MSLSPQWRRALEILASPVGATNAEMTAQGFSGEMVESLVRVGFAETTDTARSRNQSVGILRITERGRVALAVAALASAPVPGESIRRVDNRCLDVRLNKRR